MSGVGAVKSHGLQWSLGGMVAFAWRPEGFLIYERKADGTLGVRPDRLINKFAQNNYPDRDGIKEELLADGRITDENLRINTEDYKIITWPPVERPVYPAFNEESDGEDQDPKTKEGQFNSNKITAHLKLRKPKDLELATGESWYPQEEKADWCLHSPEYIQYRPEEDELVPNRFDRIICDYILEYTNDLREHAPFHPPLRGEYSPADFIVQFDEKIQYIAHNDDNYPEDYQLTQERVEKTRQFPVSTNQFQTLPLEDALQFKWWWAENIQLNEVAEAKALAEEPEDEEKRASMIAHAVVNFWKTSPGHYANMVRFDTEAMQDMAVLNIAKKNEYYAQVFMASPYWLQAGNCYWEGNESWKVLSWHTHMANRYSFPTGKALFFRGRVLFQILLEVYQLGAVVGAAISADNTTLFIALTPLLYWINALGMLRPVGYETIHIFTTEFKENKIYKHEDLTLVCSYTLEQGVVGGEAVSCLFLQSLFFNTSGTKAVTTGQVVYGEDEDQISSSHTVLGLDGFYYSNESFSVLSAKRRYTVPLKFENSTIEPDLSHIQYTTIESFLLTGPSYEFEGKPSQYYSYTNTIVPSTVYVADYKNSELLVLKSSSTNYTHSVTGNRDSWNYFLNNTSIFSYQQESSPPYIVVFGKNLFGVYGYSSYFGDIRGSGINYVASVDLRHGVFIVHDAPPGNIADLYVWTPYEEDPEVITPIIDFSNYYRIHSTDAGSLSSITKPILDVDIIGFGFNSSGNDWASAVSIKYDNQQLVAFYMPDKYVKLYSTNQNILGLIAPLPNVYPIARI